MLYTKFALQGWGIGTKLDLCMEFIDSLGVEPIFDAFLKHKIEEDYWEDLEDTDDVVKADEEEIE
jgi:hypothetical protein